jgi:MFS family permease
MERPSTTEGDPTVPVTAVLRASSRVVIANRQLSRITGTWGLWITGEWAFLVLLSVTAFDRGGTRAVAAVGVVRTIPGALAAPALSLAADRLSRVHVLVGVLLSWTAFVALVPAALLADSLAPMYVIVGAASITSTLLRPAINALIPQVVDRPDELAAANSAYSLLEAAGSLIGPLLAGLLVSTAASTTRYVITAAVFGAAALLGAGVRTDFKPPERVRGVGWRRVLEPLRGFPALVGPRRLRVVFGVCMAQSATRGLLNVLVVAAAVSLLHSGLSSTGPLFAAIGAGGLLGAVLTMAGTGLRPALPFVVGMSLWGLPFVLIAAHPSIPVTWVALAIIGIGNAIGDVYGLTLVHRLIPDHLLGRAFGAFWGTAAATCALGSVAALGLIDWLGLRSAILVVGLTMLSISLVSWFSVRHIETDLAVDQHRVDVLRRCALFAPLTRVAIEQLARHAHPLDVANGAAVVEEGQLGETFYIIDAGELEATVHGEHVRNLDEGDCFGEIAALNHTTRTATVTALAQSRLLAVDGRDFVLAITGHGPAEQSAREMVSERIARGAAHPPPPPA